MMYLPTLIPYDVKEVTLSSFKGINKGKVCSENEFFDTEGLWSSQYPMLSSMPCRYCLDSIETGTKDIGVFDNDGIGILYQKEGVPVLRYKDEDIGGFVFPEGISSANILNFNSKTFMIKEENAYEFDAESRTADIVGYTLNIDAAHESPESPEATLRLSLVYSDGSEIGSFSMSTEDAEFPTDAEKDDCFAKNLTYYRLVYKNITIPENSIWQVQTSVRLRFDIAADFRNFKAGDYVRLKELKYWNWTIRSFPDLERFIRIEYIDDEGRYVTEPIEIFEDMSIILTERTFPSNDISGYDYPLIDNTGNDLYMLDGEISACMPSIDFICANANRVWGCSNREHEIYSSEQGNARNWSVFEGLASDSYAASIASQGDFTAAVNYLGTPIFFKEDEMIIINGSRPSNYQLTAYSCRGVSKDSPMGVCVVNDTLYYKSCDGIYAYSGSRPECVSKQLGNAVRELSSVVMQGEGDMLLVSGEEKGEYRHYVYDISREIWHSYCAPRTVGYLKYPDALLEFCENDGVTEIYTLFNGIPEKCGYSDGIRAEEVWYWESSDIFYNTTDRKYIGRIKLDTECSGASQLYISYDGGSFFKICDIPPHKRGKQDITLFPRCCGHFRIRMEGKGSFELYAVTKEVEEVKENG